MLADLSVVLNFCLSMQEWYVRGKNFLDVCSGVILKTFSSLYFRLKFW
jgi:hypothetical protein